jgi:predicted nucleic acid-binding Zn ribbon protein
MIKLRECQVCGKEQYATAKFKTCSNNCRQKLHRQKKATNKSG